jgi:tetrapyrrole methylase family protein/MazG family protein
MKDQKDSPDTDEAAAHQREVERAFGRLYAIVRRLRGPDGCPWDREQTPYSIRTNLVEEAYECVSAIEEADDANLREELGDLLLVVSMTAYMKEEEGAFRLTDSLEEICAKLVRRHPHVFADAVTETPEAVVHQWNEIKAKEKGKEERHSVLERVPRTLPPLERAYLIQQKVSRVGFDWQEPGPVWDKIAEEMAELKEAAESGHLHLAEEEFGDLLFTVVNLGRLMNLDPTLALNSTNQKFIRRFQELERQLSELGRSPAESGLEEMDEIWNSIKAADKS